MNKLWWFNRNQIAKTISTSKRFTTCRSQPAAAVAIDSTQCCPQVSVQSCSPSILEWTSRT